MRKLLIGLALCAALFVAPALADVIIGIPPNPSDGNCFPWGCDYNAEYQQVYEASNFDGPITITDIEFYNTQVDDGSTSLPSGTFEISLSTTSVGVGTITGDFNANKGADNTVVFTGSIEQPWSFGNTLHIELDNPFNYDPANGNLLLDVLGMDVSIPGGMTFFDIHSGDDMLFLRVYCPGGQSCDIGTVEERPGYGLVTGFSTGNAVPEPGTLLMLGSGLIGAVGVVRRRLL